MFNNNGVIQGAYLNNLNMVDEINDRISIRNKPSQPIKPNLSFRPVSMKYNSMSIGDNKNTNYNVGINSYPSYKTTDIFNPGNSVISGPPEGYQLNVDNESDLRNQVLPLNLCNNSLFSAKIDSDMYINNIELGDETKQTHPLLFHKDHFNNFNPNVLDLPNEHFQNCTRNQRTEDRD